MKYLLLLLAVALVLSLLFYRRMPRLSRRTGRLVGDLGRAGRELVTGEEVTGSPLARYEVQSGEIVAARLLSRNPLSPDVSLQARVRSVGSRLALHARRREIPYRFSVVESPEPNAFAVPGGAIFISRPLLELCETGEDCIAGVLAHEVIHVDRFHAVRILAATAALRTGVHVLSLGRAALLSRLAAGMEELLVNGYRQDQEMEADALGIRVARLAGFDPRGLLELLKRIQSTQLEGKGTLAEILSYFRTHPPMHLRLDNLAREIIRLGA